MSNHLAVATVSAALGQVVHQSVQTAVSGVTVRFGHPVAQASGSHERRVHVYLYQVTPHAALRNADLPGRDATGRLTRRPQAALELHYLLTFYGDDQALEPDRMLGAVVRDLHATPTLSRQDVADAIGSYAAALGPSDLADAVERVRFTPVAMTLEEQSKLWSVMLQTPHALSLAYVASVVLLDALETATAPLPVLRRGADDRGPVADAGAFPTLGAAWIGFVASADRQPRPPSLRAAPLGARVVIAGDHLGGDDVTLSFRHPSRPEQRIGIPAEDRDGGLLRLTLPDDAAAANAWAAGLYGVVATVTSGGSSAVSAIWPFLVAPRIVAIVPNPVARVAGAATLTVTVVPTVRQDQRATLLLASIETASRPRGGDTDTLVFDLDPAPALVDALVRVRVDGVESQPWVLDADHGTFVFDAAQRVTIT